MAKKAEETTTSNVETGLTIVKVDPKEFGLDATKMASHEKAFMPKIIERDALIEVYKNILTQEMTPETFKMARECRLKLVKVRTGIADIHKAEKALNLAEGKYIDALKNKNSMPGEQMEERLQEIEDYAENIEKERKTKLKNARLLLLSDYKDFDAEFVDLENMDGATFDKLLKQQEDLQTFNAQQAAKKIKEEAELEFKKQLEFKRFSETVQLQDFILNYENLILSELTEQAYHELLIKAQNDQVAADLKAIETEKENARLKKEKDALEAKAEAERKAAADKLKAEQDKAAKEKAASDAKIKKLQDQAAKEKAAKDKIISDKVAADKVEADKQKALQLAPDKEKLTAWIGNLKLENIEVTSGESEAIRAVIKQKFDAFIKWSTEQIDSIK